MRDRAGRHPAVQIDGLHVQLGAHSVLEGIDLEVADGQTLALLGANGSGKTTLVRALLGLVPPTRGRIAVYGADLAMRRTVPWSRVGYVPQRVNAQPGMSVTAEEVVAAGLLDHRRLTPGPHARERAQDALGQVGLRERARDNVHLFSGGQQQRVLIARALIRRPDLLIIDEPLSGIDQDSQAALAVTLRGLQARGTTILVVLHDPGALAPLIHRTVVLDHGRVSHDGAAGIEGPPSRARSTLPSDAWEDAHVRGTGRAPHPDHHALDLTTGGGGSS
ncbi:metal ABC transporter ATP-binding protein [Arthrobacter sp. N1]|uniref:metal ABC transporter ATP-binding protein n=1 Tax=Arthrobacter sp. N1 TaxID=619291 RepID=UPI003BAEC172